jgi:hypothetical protein
MASPKILTFAVFNTTTGVPQSGLAGSLVFASYKDDTGANLTQPSFVEIGSSGIYYFLPVFTANRGIAFMIATGANPAYVSGYLRPEDFNIDNADATTSSVATAVGNVLTALATAQTDLTLIKKLQTNKWEIKVTGPDANRMIFYDDDDVTPILKVDLLDQNGLPTSTNPYARTPV